MSLVDEISNSSGETIPETLQSEIRTKAKSVRKDFLNRDFPSGNVSVAKAQLSSGMEICKEGTSRHYSPTPLPKPKSEGGIFEPSIDSLLSASNGY